MCNVVLNLLKFGFAHWCKNFQTIIEKTAPGEWADGRGAALRAEVVLYLSHRAMDIPKKILLAAMLDVLSEYCDFSLLPHDTCASLCLCIDPNLVMRNSGARYVNLNIYIMQPRFTSKCPGTVFLPIHCHVSLSFGITRTDWSEGCPTRRKSPCAFW